MTKTANNPAQSDLDPLACFVASDTERSGVWIDVENPKTGEVLMRWKLARFGGQNRSAIVREERKLKSRLTQGQRRAIDAGEGDPDVVQKMNRQTFVRVSCLDWELVNEKLREKYGTFSHEAADAMFEAYPVMYDDLAEQALNEQNYAVSQVEDRLGN